MSYDLKRAAILLADLQRIGEKEMPVAQLARSSEGQFAVVGTFTRLGLMRFGVDLAQAALHAKTQIVVHENGFVDVGDFRSGGVLNLVLGDKPLMKEEMAHYYMLPRINCLPWSAVGVLSIIGLTTVVRWMLALVGS